MIAKYRPLFAPIAVIAAGIALAVVFWWIGQPRTTHRGSVLDNLPPRPPAPTATPIYVTTLPGITERQIRETPRVVNCTLRPGQEYETRRVLYTNTGARYVLIRTADGCNGWIYGGY